MGWFSKKPDSNTPVQVMNDRWNMYFKWVGENEQWPIMFFFDETYAEKSPDDYNEAVEFTTFYSVKEPVAIQENGFPLASVNAEIQKREDQLVERITAAHLHVKYVVRLVGAARKTYRFQARDGEALVKILRQWASEMPFVTKTDERTGKGWTQYENALPKMGERMQISDRNLIETLLQNGAQEDEAYPLDFTFTGPADKLDIIQKDLEEEEFVTTLREPNRLEVQRPLPLDLKTIYHFTSYMLMSSMAHDCSYDGWGCKLN